MANHNCESVEVNCEMWPEPVRKAFNFVRRGMILRGILYVLFGILMLCRPAETMLTLTLAIGIFVLIDGFALLFSSFRCTGKKKIPAIIGSILFILLGIFICSSPLVMNLVWVMMLGFWEIFSGIQCLCFVRKNSTMPIFSGILSLLVGILLISSPFVSWVAIIWVSGVMLLVSGIFSVITGFCLKNALK